MKLFLLTLCLLFTTTVARADLSPRDTLQNYAFGDEVPRNHWSYGALVAICDYLDFDSYSWMHYELYGGRDVRPISLTRFEFALLAARISEKTSTFNDVDYGVQQRREQLELVDVMAALQTAFAYELKRLGVRPGAIEYSK